MTKRGATKTTITGNKGFSTGLQLLAQKRNRFPGFQSRPYHEFSDSNLTAALISRSQLSIEDLDGTTFYISLLDSIGRLNTSTPDNIRHDIGGFAMANPGLLLAHEFTMFDFLRDHLGVTLTLDEYTDWWRTQLQEQPRALIPFLMAAASMLDAQIAIWAQGRSGNLTATHLFSPPNFGRQLHFVADRHISVDPSAKMDRIIDYNYTMEHHVGWLYSLGTPSWDSRLAGRDPVPVIETPGHSGSSRCGIDSSESSAITQ